MAVVAENFSFLPGRDQLISPRAGWGTDEARGSGVRRLRLARLIPRIVIEYRRHGARQYDREVDAMKSSGVNGSGVDSVRFVNGDKMSYVLQNGGGEKIVDKPPTPLKNRATNGIGKRDDKCHVANGVEMANVNGSSKGEKRKIFTKGRHREYS